MKSDTVRRAFFCSVLKYGCCRGSDKGRNNVGPVGRPIGRERGDDMDTGSKKRKRDRSMSCESEEGMGENVSISHTEWFIIVDDCSAVSS